MVVEGSQQGYERPKPDSIRLDRFLAHRLARLFVRYGFVCAVSGIVAPADRRYRRSELVKADVVSGQCICRCDSAEYPAGTGYQRGIGRTAGRKGAPKESG